MSTPRKALNTLTFIALMATVLFADGLWRPPQNATLPASCTVGDVATKTGTGAGLYTCTATNTWTVLSTGPHATGTVTTTGSPASGNLTQFSGASSVTNGNLSGDVTTSGTLATTIANDAVTYAKLQNISASSRLLCRKTSMAGDAEECTIAEALNFIASSAQGDVIIRDASGWTRLAAGTSGYFLKTQGAAADPVWSAVTAGSGAVTTTETTITSTGTQNDLSFSNADLVRLNNASDLTITGFSACTQAGQQVTFTAIGTGKVWFKHQDMGSGATGRLINNITVGDTPIVSGGGTATYRCDATTQRWRMVTHEQGPWIPIPYAGGDWTANGSMTWTVDSGDFFGAMYRVQGRTLEATFLVSGSTVGGTANTELRWTMPNGYTAASDVPTGGGQFVRNVNNGTVEAGNGVMRIVPSVTYVAFFRAGGVNWTLATNNSGVSGWWSVPLQ